MSDLPATRASLLVRIRDGQDREAWRQFVDLYAPVVYRFARQRGLQDADAADLTQEVLRAVAATAGRLDYDPRRGTFRGWLYTVARNKLHDFARARRRQCPGSGDSGVQAVLEQQPDREQVVWDEEYEQRVFAWAAERVRGHFEESTWQAFWRVAVEGQSPRAAARALGMTLAAVYMAKSRVLARLKQEVEQLLDE